MKRLVAHLRVFIEQFIAERGIEYGLQFVTLFFLNSPDCLYIKKDCEFLQSYAKTMKSPKKTGNNDTFITFIIKYFRSGYSFIG